MGAFRDTVVKQAVKVANETATAAAARAKATAGAPPPPRPPSCADKYCIYLALRPMFEEGEGLCICTFSYLAPAAAAARVGRGAMLFALLGALMMAGGFGALSQRASYWLGVRERRRREREKREFFFSFFRRKKGSQKLTFFSKTKLYQTGHCPGQRACPSRRGALRRRGRRGGGGQGRRRGGRAAAQGARCVFEAAELGPESSGSDELCCCCCCCCSRCRCDFDPRLGQRRGTAAAEPPSCSSPSADGQRRARAELLHGALKLAASRGLSRCLEKNIWISLFVRFTHSDSVVPLSLPFPNPDYFLWFFSLSR